MPQPDHVWLPYDRGMQPVFVAGGGVTVLEAGIRMAAKGGHCG